MAGIDIVCLGEVLVDMFPAENGRRLADVSAFRPMPGGAPANVAVAARRLGASSAFIGKVGDDAFGRMLIDRLRDEGVDTRGVRVDDEARTTMAFIAMPDPQSAEFVFYRNPGADMRLRPDELDEELIATAGGFHFGSISLIAEPSRSATRRAVELAQAGGALISFDVNYRPSLWPDEDAFVAAVHDALSLVHLVKVNLAEMVLLTGTTNLIAGSEVLCQAGPQAALVTLDAAGSWFRAGRATGLVPAFNVRALDCTGCGDGFMAGVLSRLVGGRSAERQRLSAGHLREAALYGNAVGALTATRQGAMPALPMAAEVDQFLIDKQSKNDAI